MSTDKDIDAPANAGEESGESFHLNEREDLIFKLAQVVGKYEQLKIIEAERSSSHRAAALAMFKAECVIEEYQNEIMALDAKEQSNGE